MTAKTILSLANAQPAIGTPENAALIIIDAQEEYRSGALPLSGLDDALANAASLLDHWRNKGGMVIHIVHHGAPGGAVFDPDGEYVAILPEVRPQADEEVLVKNVPNSFGHTGLDDILKKAGLKNIVLAGFMTHLCVSTTARMGHQGGYGVTVIADATATRDLPVPPTLTTATNCHDRASVIPAEILHKAELAMLGDIFATIARTDAVIAA